jgi:hypothetical protein
LLGTTVRPGQIASTSACQRAIPPLAYFELTELEQLFITIVQDRYLPETPGTWHQLSADDFLPMPLGEFGKDQFDEGIYMPRANHQRSRSAAKGWMDRHPSE